MLRSAPRADCARSVSVFVRDVGHGLLEVSHNSLALLGLAVVAALVFVAGRPDLRHADRDLGAGLAAGAPRSARRRHPATLLAAAAEPDAVDRATAVDPKELTRQQAARGAVDLAPLQRGARADQPPGAGSLGRSASAPGWTRR